MGEREPSLFLEVVEASLLGKCRELICKGVERRERLGLLLALALVPSLNRGEGILAFAVVVVARSRQRTRSGKH